MASKKINIRERISDGEIDLSMSDLTEVPVKELAVYKKTFSLDLSNNHLKTLPSNFPILIHLTKLDLSKNLLKELPENFGDLAKLKYLDLYQNQLQYLPLSFSKLKALKWLDLKDNPLVPAVAKVSGPCLDAKQCQSCARDVVNFFVQVQEQIENDIELRQKQRQRQLEVNQQQNKQNDNKKAKKKEKQKQHKQQNGPLKETTGKPATKKSKNIQTIARPLSKPISLYKISLWILFTVFIIFILTSIDSKLTRGIQSNVEHLYIQGVYYLPENIQEYILIIGTRIKELHGRTGVVTTNAFNYLINKNICIYENIYNKTSQFKDIIQNGTRYFFEEYVAS